MRNALLAIVVIASVVSTTKAQPTGVAHPLTRETTVAELTELITDQSYHPADRLSFRMLLAGKLVDAGSHDEATEQYLVAWQEVPAAYPRQVGVRGRFLTRAMGKLAAGSPAARSAFEALRDDVEVKLREEPSWSDLSDWVSLNVDILGDHQRILDWVDRNISTSQGRKSIERELHKIDDILIVHGRWAQLGQVHSDIVKSVERAQQIIPPWLQSDTLLVGPAIATYEHEIAKLFVSLLAAYRIEEAAQIMELSSVMEPRAHPLQAVDRFVETYPQLRSVIERRSTMPD